MDRDRLDDRLARAFGGSEAARRVVLRQAGDLADAGRYRETHGADLTAARIVDALADAPEGTGVVDRWNWWIGALEVAHGGYERFLVRRWQA